MSGARSGDPSAPVSATSEVSRVLTSGACGLVVAAALARFAPWEVTVLASWITAATTFVGRVWRRIDRLTGAETGAVATREDASRAAAHIMVIGASVASLVGVGVTLDRASLTSGGTKVVLTAAAILTVISSWALVHTVFTLRYAHTYYRRPVGGVDFSSDEVPDYHDFAYLAFTIGMTFQVSDTDLTTTAMRRLALRHALLSYLFGAVILAMTINVTAGFVL
jgi:Predicted membrane protein